jgi:hypothetical protein
MVAATSANDGMVAAPVAVGAGTRTRLLGELPRMLKRHPAWDTPEKQQRPRGEVVARAGDGGGASTERQLDRQGEAPKQGRTNAPGGWFRATSVAVVPGPQNDPTEAPCNFRASKLAAQLKLEV